MKDPMRFIEIAEAHRRDMNKALAPLNEAIQKVLDDDSADIFYQTDGWCVLWGDANNSPIGFIDIESLLNMSKEDALKYLHSYSI